MSTDKEGDSLKAIRFHKFGACDELLWVDQPTPQINEHEVLVKVSAFG